MTLHPLLHPIRRILTTVLVTAVGTAGLAVTAPVSASAAPVATVTTALAGGLASTAKTASPGISGSTYERRLQRWVNVRRSDRGLGRVRIASCTDTVAEQWGRYLASSGKFYHQSMSRLLTRCEARYAAETLGRGRVSPKRLVYLWMHSSGHRRILLSPKARRIGVGARVNANGAWVVCATFMRL